jgi:hypothetical protein
MGKNVIEPVASCSMWMFLWGYEHLDLYTSPKEALNCMIYNSWSTS